MRFVGLQVAIIGAGIIGNRVSGQFMRNSDVEIRWICDIDLDKAKTLAAKYNSKVTSDYNEVITDEMVDIVYVGVPPKYHKEIAITALQAEKHVLSEKPLAFDMKEAMEMVEAERKSNKNTGVNLPFRYTPAVPKMKEMLAAGEYGTLKRLELIFRFPQWPRQWQPNPWLTKKEQGGPIREVGTHFIFLLNELEPWLGKITQVWSKMEYPNDEDSEISGISLIKFDSELICTSNLLVKSAEPEQNTLRIVGDQNVTSFEMWWDLFEIDKEGKKTDITPNDMPEISPISNFLKNVRGEQTPVKSVSFNEAMKAQRIIDVMLNSDEKWIDIK